MKKGIISVLALILSLGALAGVRINTAKANTGVTYYVSSSEGDDANDGTSEDKPFRTFSNINGKLLGAGDKVLLKRGDVWNERLEILAQGTSDNFVEISCYGNADLDKPTIRMNEGDDDVCVLVKDFYYNGQRPVQ
ncbi:MAG: hypothetical protein J6Z34_03170, partial [Clostridia bacterium]|nr:hypothetical protein [Clostridia bacterium]